MTLSRLIVTGAPKADCNSWKAFQNSAIQLFRFSLLRLTLCPGAQGAPGEVLPPVQQPEGQPDGRLPAPRDHADAAGGAVPADQGQRKLG